MIELEKEIRESLGISRDCVDSFLLYGSYARGDYHLNSDVDVLRITTSRQCTNRVDGHVSLHYYDIKDLLSMARQGNLFILHLITEAKPLHDPRNYLGALSSAFIRPESYAAQVRRWITPTAPLLQINESLFDTTPREFMAVAFFLCRTLLYGDQADCGPFSFSLSSLAAQDENAAALLQLKMGSGSYTDFCQVRQIICSKLGNRVSHDTVASIQELADRGRGDPLFESLFRRILEGQGVDAYLIPLNLAICGVE
jgi:predicted nucleotidyltransferase